MAEKVRFVLPAALASHCDGRRSFELEAESVRDAVDSLTREAPQLKPHLIDSTGQLMPFVNLFVDNTQVRDLNQSEPKLSAGSELLLVSALAGG